MEVGHAAAVLQLPALRIVDFLLGACQSSTSLSDAVGPTIYPSRILFYTGFAWHRVVLILFLQWYISIDLANPIPFYQGTLAVGETVLCV